MQLRPSGNSEQAGFDVKLGFLLAMYDTMTVGKTMIFVATRNGANQLALAMRRQGHQPSVITGECAAAAAAAVSWRRVIDCPLICSVWCPMDASIIPVTFRVYAASTPVLL